VLGGTASYEDLRLIYQNVEVRRDHTAAVISLGGRP